MDTMVSGVDLSDGAWITAIFTEDLPWFVTVIALLVLPLVVASAMAVCRRQRRFWCAAQRREVEAEFEEREFFGRSRAVVRCSAFETPEAITCSRRCLDAAFRRQWESPLPVFDRRRP